MSHMESRCTNFTQFSKSPAPGSLQPLEEQSDSFPESVSLFTLQPDGDSVKNSHEFILKKDLSKSPPETVKTSSTSDVWKKSRGNCV